MALSGMINCVRWSLLNTASRSVELVAAVSWVTASV